MQSLGVYGRPRTNAKVIEAWQRGVSARNHKHTLTSSTHLAESCLDERSGLSFIKRAVTVNIVLLPDLIDISF